MFPFCWRICVREVVLLLLAEPDRGEKDPAHPPVLTPLLTSSDFSISAFWRERESQSVQKNIIISAVAGLD